MEYIITDNEDRMKMHYYAHSILGIPQTPIKLPNFPQDIWDSSDKYVIIQFIKEIEKLGKVKKPIESISWLNELISFTLKKGLEPNEFKKYSIFPNQYNCFRPIITISDLFYIYDLIKYMI